jgi:GR25 family glycosyltransferase involved in LPS biosynthesis
MNIKVISLNTAIERREYIENHLSSQSLNFSFIDAVEGSTIEDGVPKLHKNAIACFLSHKMALEWASKQSEPTLILEDDAFSIRGINEEIKKILNTDQLWDIVFLGWKSRERVAELDELFVKSNMFILAHAYLANPIGAKRILTFLGNATEHVDIRICELGRKNIIRVLLLKDKLFYQKGFASQIPKLKITKKK